MTDGIEIKVGAPGATEASNNLDKLTGSIERMKGRLDESVKAGAEQNETLGDLSNAFSQLGLTIGAAQVLGAVKEWTLQADKLSDSLSTLGGRSVEFASTLTSGAVTQMDAAAARSRLLTAGLDLTNEQFEALTAASAAFAQGSGQEATAVMGQLTGALITGSDRGLRPFVGSLREGASRAEIQAEAIRRLTAASQDNQAQLAANAGSLDALGWGWDKVKEKLGATYLAMLDAPFTTLLPAISDTTKALNGDMGLADAATNVARRFAELNSAVPGAGGALAGFISDALGASTAADAAADSAARLANRLARLRGAAGSGFNMADDVASIAEGSEATAMGAGFYNAQRRGRDAAVERDLGDPATVGTGERLIDTSYGAGRAARRRGGGGGGRRRRGPLDETDLMSDTPRQLADDARDYSGEDSLFGIGEGAWAAGQLRGANEQSDRPGTRTSARDAMNNGIERQISTYERLESRGKSVLDSLNKAWESHFAAFSKGEESFGKAMKGMASAALESIATQSLQEAGFQFAKGLGSLASMDYPGAALHFASAAAFGVIAGGAYAGSAAIAPSSSRSAGASGGDSFRTPTSSSSLGQRAANDGPGLTIMFNLAPGSIVGGGDQRATQDWLAQQVREGIERNDRIRRAA